MPEITNMNEYSFKFSDVVGDYLSQDTTDIKDKLDLQPREVRTFVIGLVNLLNSIDGANSLSAKGFDNLKTTIQSMLNDLNTRKLDQGSNFIGTWQGLTPSQVEPGLSALVDSHTLQLNDIVINVRTYGMVADGLFDNLAIFNTLKTQYPNAQLFFPRQGSNLTYYFSTSRPNLGGIRIKADDGVIFKVDAIPDLKQMQLLSPVIFQNTAHSTTLEKHKNIDYEKVLTNIGPALHDIKNEEKYSLIDMTTWDNKVYVTATGDISGNGTATKATNQISWATAFTGSPQLIKPTTLVAGTCYEVNVNTPISGFNVGLFMKTSTNEIIKLENSIGTVAWTKKRITAPSTVSENITIIPPNGSAYACVTGQEQNFSIFYKNAKEVYFMVADHTLFKYNGEYGDITDIGFLTGQSSSSNSVVWKDAVKTDNYVYRKQKPLKLGLLGDSISYGAWNGLPPENILPIMLQNVNGIGKVSVTNYSISGRSTVNWASDISTYNFAGLDYVLVMLGTNDIQGGTALATFTANLTTIANKIIADGSKPIFQIFPVFTNTANSGVTGVTTTNYSNHAIYSQALKKFCIQNNYEFGNARRNFGANLEWYGDNIHPTEEGQIAVLKSWAEVLTRVLIKG